MSEGHDGGGDLRWLLTYADMITLLMAFFIMMYSMSVISVEKFDQAAASLRSEFGTPGRHRPGGGSGLLPHPGRSAGVQLEEPLQSVKDELEEYIEENDLQSLIQTTEEVRGLVITLVSDNLLFPVGEATLRAPALSIVNEIAGLLQDIPNLIVIEGHTCSLAIKTSRYPSNWELSAARACAVTRYLVEQWGIDEVRLAATGYAASRPVESNDREEGRAKNRRVEIVLLASGPASEGEGEGAPASAGEVAGSTVEGAEGAP